MKTNNMLVLIAGLFLTSFLFAQATDTTASTVTNTEKKKPKLGRYQKMLEESIKTMDKKEKQSAIEGEKEKIAAKTRNPELDPLLPASEEITESIMFFDPRAAKILEKIQIFPKNNPWNEDITKRPIAKTSNKMIEAMNQADHLDINLDMNFVIVPPNQKRTAAIQGVVYKDGTDLGPYPIPYNIPIEGWPLWVGNGTPGGNVSMESLKAYRSVYDGADRHAVAIDPVNMKLYEFYQMWNEGDGIWRATGAAIFDLTTNKTRWEYSGLKIDSMGLTSTDAAGLPIFPSIPRFDEFQKGAITHALRFTARNSRYAYVWPATHCASLKRSEILPRMGERFRLRSTFNTKQFPPQAAVILEALKKYGMFMADNGGDWRVSISPDPRWNLKDIYTICGVKKNNFEVIVPTGPNEGPREGEDNKTVIKSHASSSTKKEKKKAKEEEDE